jgi:hypothetical protein
VSKFTTEFRHLLSSVDVFSRLTYPIYDEAYREVLHEKIKKRYYFREVGFETAELFIWHLDRLLNEIMPYYNEIYKSQLVLIDPEFNPLHNLNTTETHIRTAGSESFSEGTTNGKETFSDTPSSQLGNLDYATNISEGESGSNASVNARTTEEYTTMLNGSGGMRYPADIINEFQKVIQNIDVLILDELNTLFMAIY